MSNTVISRLHALIDDKDHGILLSVKLLNSDELNILLQNSKEFINKFYFLVESLCDQVKETHLIKHEEKDTIYIVLHNDHDLADRLTLDIYSKIQLYVNLDYPEGYLQCNIGKIKFSNQNKIPIDKLLSLLSLSMQDLLYQKNYHYHNEYCLDIGDLKERNKRLNAMRKSLCNNKIQFMYQPIIDRRTGIISYYECLLRMPDKNDNLISVGPMIEDAESKGVITIIDHMVLDMAIEELTKNQDATLAINISNLGLLNQTLLKKACELLGQHQVANRLIIEITETSLNNHYNHTKHFIDTLHTLGCRFALDDFGSGFTSFKQLSNLCIDIIKIDGSYIRDITQNKQSKLFVEALINLASSQGIKTVAEFVENGEIAKYLVDTDISAMQGNFFMPASNKIL